MNRAKIFIAFTFLLAFAVCVSAQDKMPKIVWQNLQERYERFEDVALTISNKSNFSVSMPQSISSAIEYGFVRLLKFDEKQNKWMPNEIWICGTMTKKERRSIAQNLTAYKLNSNAKREIKLDGVDWFGLTKSYYNAGFTELPDYNGRGKYKFQVLFTVNSRNSFVLESPEFEVIERDFKK